MLKQLRGTAVWVLALALAGCATTGNKNYQGDIDALNARLTALQGQLAEKDQEISSLQTQVADQRMAKEAAEAALSRAEDVSRAPGRSAPASDLK